MYSILLPLHSIVRWLVLVFLILAIYRAFIGYLNNRSFSRIDNAIRHWTATTAHIQLMIGILIYTQSPIVKYFWNEAGKDTQHLELTFYGVIHAVLMLTAIVVMTIGSALAKRKLTDKDRFKTMLIWFTIALILIFVAIPWSFSPFSSRPHFRTF